MTYLPENDEAVFVMDTAKRPLGRDKSAQPTALQRHLTIGYAQAMGLSEEQARAIFPPESPDDLAAAVEAELAKEEDTRVAEVKKMTVAPRVPLVVYDPTTDTVLADGESGVGFSDFYGDVLPHQIELRPARPTPADDWSPMGDARVVALRLVLWKALQDAGVRVDDRQAETAVIAVLAEWPEWTEPVP